MMAEKTTREIMEALDLELADHAITTIREEVESMAFAAPEIIVDRLRTLAGSMNTLGKALCLVPPKDPETVEATALRLLLESTRKERDDYRAALIESLNSNDHQGVAWAALRMGAHTGHCANRIVHGDGECECGQWKEPG